MCSLYHQVSSSMSSPARATGTRNCKTKSVRSSANKISNAARSWGCEQNRRRPPSHPCHSKICFSQQFRNCVHNSAIWDQCWRWMGWSVCICRQHDQHGLSLSPAPFRRACLLSLQSLFEASANNDTAWQRERVQSIDVSLETRADFRRHPCDGDSRSGRHTLDRQEQRRVHTW